MFGALTQNRSSLEDRTTTRRCHRASGRCGVSTLLGNLACILRHPDLHDAKIGSLQTLLPHLPSLIEQPAFGPVRIANELKKRGLTAHPPGLKRSASRFWLHQLGVSTSETHVMAEPAPLDWLRKQHFLLSLGRRSLAMTSRCLGYQEFGIPDY
jgi:hypothetical protein